MRVPGQKALATAGADRSIAATSEIGNLIAKFLTELKTASSPVPLLGISRCGHWFGSIRVRSFFALRMRP
jgi:hypothetical protein